MSGASTIMLVFWRRLVLAIDVTTVVGSMSACVLQSPTACPEGQLCEEMEANVTNATSGDVTIVRFDQDGDERGLLELVAGQTLPIVGVLRPDAPCLAGPLIARSDSGEVVARREDPLCDQETWVVRTGVPPWSS